MVQMQSRNKWSSLVLYGNIVVWHCYIMYIIISGVIKQEFLTANLLSVLKNGQKLSR
jgi:hypothetical protein